jgi:hypothetical protein
MGGWVDPVTTGFPAYPSSPPPPPFTQNQHFQLALPLFGPIWLENLTFWRRAVRPSDCQEYFSFEFILAASFFRTSFPGSAKVT